SQGAVGAAQLFPRGEGRKQRLGCGPVEGTEGSDGRDSNEGGRRGRGGRSEAECGEAGECREEVGADEDAAAWEPIGEGAAEGAKEDCRNGGEAEEQADRRRRLRRAEDGDGGRGEQDHIAGYGDG